VNKSAFIGEVKTWVELHSELGFNGNRSAGFVGEVFKEDILMFKSP
jgi:hypothetical protein